MEPGHLHHSALTVHRVQMHGASNRDTHLYLPHNSSFDNNNLRVAHWADHQWNGEWANNPTRLSIFIPDTAKVGLQQKSF